MKRLLFFIVGLLIVLSVSAQEMKSVFLAMPDSLTPLLTRVNKEDCIDFLASNMKAEVKNRFDKPAEMKVLTDDYLQIQMTESSALELKLLPLNDTTKVVCMIRTFCTSACDSKVRFYTSDWKEELDAGTFLQQPSGDAFFLPGDTLTEEGALLRRKADMHLMKASLSKDDASITFVYTTPDYLNKEDREKLMPYLRQEPIVFRWQEGKFR